MKKEERSEWIKLVNQLRMENRKDFTINLDDFEKILGHVSTKERYGRWISIRYREGESNSIKERMLSVYIDADDVKEWDQFFTYDGEFKRG